MTTTELLQRLEKAEGGDRTLDHLINVTVLGNRTNCKKFTTSIDAAVSLAERLVPGWQINLSIFTESLSEAAIGSRFSGNKSTRAVTPALAICLAVLRAHIAQGGGA